MSRNEADAMKAIAVRRETATRRRLCVDRVLCHDVRDAGGARSSWPQGRRDSTPTAAATLLARRRGKRSTCSRSSPATSTRRRRASGWPRAVVGDGVEVKGYTGGQWTLTATRRGLLRIDAAPLTDVNAHEGISVFTLFDGQPVEAGETVAKAKVTPLAHPRADDRRRSRPWPAPPAAW